MAASSSSPSPTPTPAPTPAPTLASNKRPADTDRRSSPKKPKVDYGECSICCEELTKKTKAKYHCEKFIVCVACVRKWALDNPKVSCLGCNNTIPYKDLVTYAGRSFCENEYKKRRQEVLFEKLKVPTPEIRILVSLNRIHESLKKLLTQRNTEWFLKLVAMYNEHCSPVDTLSSCKSYLSTIREWFEYVGRHVNNTDVAFDLDMLMDCCEHSRKFLENVKECKYITSAMRKPPERYGTSGVSTKKFVTKGFPCAERGCIGIVMKSDGTCTACGVTYCVKCQEHKPVDDTEHECDESVVASLKTAEENSTQCPKCCVRIQRSEGCSQMYCTQCGQFFNYNTGNPISGLVHNPHAINAANVIDIGCGRHIKQPNIYEVQKSYNIADIADVRKYIDMVHELIQTYNERMPHLRRYPIRNVQDPFRKCVIDYMTSINAPNADENFKKKLQQIEKRVDKQMEYGLLMQVMVDAIGTLLASLKKDNYFKVMHDISAYCKELQPNIMLIKKNFGNTLPAWLVKMLKPTEWSIPENLVNYQVE